MPGQNQKNAHGKMRKPKNMKKTIGRLFGYLSQYKIRLILVVICIILSSGATIASSYLLKPVINDYLTPLIATGGMDVSGFVTLLCSMGGVFLVGIVGAYCYNRIMVSVSSGAMKQIRTDMFNHMEGLPIKYFDKHTHGEVMSRYTNDTDALREMLSQSFPQLISSTISIVGVFAMMLILSRWLTLISIVMLVVMLIVVKKIGGKSSKYFMKQQRELGKVNGYIEEMIEGQKVVKVFNHENEVKREFDTLNAELCTAAKHAHTFANILMPIMGNLSYVLYAVTAVAGSLFTIAGTLDVGTVVSFLQYTRNFANPITMISQQINSILLALAGAERIFELMDEPLEEDDGKAMLIYANVAEDGSISESKRRTGKWAWKLPRKEGGYEYVLLRGDVRFHNVTFGYDPEEVVLNDVSLYAKPGQKIAFVGSTGAGKTTITNLINRFYDIQRGQITYDGIDIRDIKKDDLRRSLSMVLQDTHLFTGTVRDNIRYGRLDATDEEVVAAAKSANAHSFIKHLPQGYDTMLTADGVNLSQGQRQLLAIARAAVADQPVLILDEATSSIDTRTEALIEKGMDQLMEGRTVFVIAHRLSTVRNANAIMVLEHGTIIERGDHADLIEQKGRYYQLYTGAFELE